MGTGLVDVDAGMPAEETVYAQLSAMPVGGRPRGGNRQAGFNGDAARATEIKRAPFFGVQIEQDLPLQCSRLQAARAAHAGFFIYGQQNFQLAARQAVVFQRGERQRDADAVVRAQCRVTCQQPARLDFRRDRVVLKIMHAPLSASAGLLAHHVQMPLQDDAGRVFPSGRGGSGKYQVAHGVGAGGDAARFRPVCEVRDQRRLML